MHPLTLAASSALAQSGGGDTAVGLVPWAAGLVICLAGVGLLIFWVWMLIDCIQRDFEGSGKTIWLLVIVLLNVLGAVAYFIIGKNTGTKPAPA